MVISKHCALSLCSSSIEMYDNHVQQQTTVHRRPLSSGSVSALEHVHDLESLTPLSFDPSLSPTLPQSLPLSLDPSLSSLMYPSWPPDDSVHKANQRATSHWNTCLQKVSYVYMLYMYLLTTLLYYTYSKV